MLNIDRILKKKGWTGAELGKLELANTALAYKKAVKADNPEQEPAISRADFEKMLSTLKDPTEGRVYNGYISIHNWISNTMQIAIAQNQQAQLQFDKLWSFIQNAITAEDLYSYIEELPLIMTEKQYKETVEKRTKEILKPDGEDIADNVLQLVFDALNYYIKLLETNPRAKNPLKPLKKKLEKELVRDPHILEKYNKVMGLGYYTLEGGTRSDKLSPSEWRQLITPTIFKMIDEDSQLGEKEAQLIKHSIVERRLITDARYMYEGDLTEREAQKKRRKDEEKEGFIKACQWHYYEDSPEGLLTKWEVITGGGLLEYYNYYEDGQTKEEALEVCKAFVAEFPTVVKALLDDMGKKYGLKELKDLPIEKWLETIISWEDLYKLDFYGFRATQTADIAIFDGNKRALFNGVAILRASELGCCTRIDPETGYYTAPDLRKSLLPLSLEAFFTDNEEYSNNVDIVEQARSVLKSSIFFVDGFNKALELIASLFDVEEVKLFAVETGSLKNRVEALNSSIYTLYRRIKNTDYEDPELREKKLEVLRDIFQPVDLKKLRIPEEKLEQAKQNMKDFKGFKDSSIDPYLQLCIYKPEYEEEEKPFIDFGEEPDHTDKENGEVV